MAEAARFMLPRNRTIASTCGISIEFKKGELHLVPPAMFDEVIAAGGVPEHELDEEDLPKKTNTPEALAARKEALFKVFDDVVLRNVREEFTAGGMPHNRVLSEKLGWSVDAKERDTAWVEYMATKDDRDEAPAPPPAPAVETPAPKPAAKKTAKGRRT